MGPGALFLFFKDQDFGEKEEKKPGSDNAIRVADTSSPDMKSVAGKVWPKDKTRPEIHIIKEKEITTIWGEHYILVENFLFINREAWQANRKKLERYKKL